MYVYCMYMHIHVHVHVYDMLMYMYMYMYVYWPWLLWYCFQWALSVQSLGGDKVHRQLEIGWREATRVFVSGTTTISCSTKCVRYPITFVHGSLLLHSDNRQNIVQDNIYRLAPIGNDKHIYLKHLHVMCIFCNQATFETHNTGKHSFAKDTGMYMYI